MIGQNICYSLDLSLHGTETINRETYETWLHYGFYPQPVQPVQGITVTISGLSTTIYHWFDVGMDLGRMSAGLSFTMLPNTVFEVMRDARLSAAQRMTSLDSDDHVTMAKLLTRVYLILFTR